MGTQIASGKCPSCGSEGIEYGGYDLDGASVAYDWLCDKCPAHGREYYELSFLEIVAEGERI